MATQGFDILNTTGVPLPIENIDTDQIIPARFLKATTREGFGQNLFRDWRYDKEGNPKEAFVLNNPIYQGEILVAGKNFGCGSSREHAAWAIADYGFKCVVSSFFADIFRNNSLNNGILPIQIPEDHLSSILQQIQDFPATQLIVDLEKQQFRVPDLDLILPFEINPYKKHCLLQGLNDFDFLIGQKGNVEAFEKKNIYTLAEH